MSTVSIPTSTNYSGPAKKIHDSQGLQAFHTSIALQDLTAALTKFTLLVEGKSVPHSVLDKRDLYTVEEIQKYEREISVPITSFNKSTDQLQAIYENKPIVKAIVDFLERFSNLIDDIPPLQGPRRFGNMSRRKWQDVLETNIDNWLNELIIDPFYRKDNKAGFLKEIRWYILNAFGSRERLDYGTGHELNFLAFLTGLWKVGIFVPDDEIDGYDILIVFGQYYTVTRKLIVTYTLEPAGSHGVWGLDDHFHIIYILGASQLLNAGHHQISPRLVRDRSVVFQHCEDNLYFNAIAFINKVKKAPFFEHSPILYDVSNVRDWEKILKGMIKMYLAEVLNKFPVVQHFYFGNVLFPWIDATTGKELPVSGALDDDDDAKKDRNDPLVTTPAPWKSMNPEPSFQDKVISNSQARGRLPASGYKSTYPMGRPGMGPVENTRVPWARK